MELHYLTSEEEVALKAAIPWGEIDSRIRDVVWLASGVKGIATVQSCEGHVRRGDGYFVVDMALVAFRATRERTLEFLFEVVPGRNKGCVSVEVRYFNDGTLWLSVGVDPSERGRLGDLFKRFK